MTFAGRVELGSYNRAEWFRKKCCHILCCAKLLWHPNSKISCLNVAFSPGLGIRSSVFWAICSFFVSERAKEQYAHETEQIAPVALLSRATWANCSRLLFCHERPEQIALCSLFVKSDGSESLKLLKKRVNEQRLVSDLSESLMVAHLSWVTWAICSRSLFWYERPERFTHSL